MFSTCPAVLRNQLGFSEVIPTGVSLFWLLSSLASENDALITNISVIQTWRWFFATTPFESVFLAFIMLQILALQLIGILPVNINQFIHGLASGRRKRSVFLPQQCNASTKNLELAEHILQILYKIDRHACILRTLCEVQKQSNFDDSVPDTLLFSLSTLSSLNKCGILIKPNTKDGSDGTNDSKTSKRLPLYQEAIALGQESSHSRNSTDCQEKYNICPLSAEEIMSYLNQMRLNEMF